MTCVTIRLLCRHSQLTYRISWVEFGNIFRRRLMVRQRSSWRRAELESILTSAVPVCLTRIYGISLFAGVTVTTAAAGWRERAHEYCISNQWWWKAMLWLRKLIEMITQNSRSIFGKVTWIKSTLAHVDEQIHEIDGLAACIREATVKCKQIYSIDWNWDPENLRMMHSRKWRCPLQERFWVHEVGENGKYRLHYIEPKECS